MILVAGSGLDGDESAPGGVTVFDETTLRQVGHTAPVDELMYLAIDPSGSYLYGVSGLAVGLVHAWRIGPSGGELVRVGEPVGSGGAEPCQVVVDQSGSFVLVANYGGSTPGSVAVLPILDDGSVGTATILTRVTAPGPDPERQRESHIHQVVPVPGGEVLVVDLGADEVVSYLLREGRLIEPVVSRAPAGCGPRHLVRLPDGRVLLSAELDSTLLRARLVGRELIGWSATPSTGFKLAPGVRNYPSDVQVAGAGDVVYLANRGADSVAKLSVRTGGILAETRCGAWPRQLALDGDRVYVACTNANQVTVLDGTGMIATHPPISLARPMCVVIRTAVDDGGNTR